MKTATEIRFEMDAKKLAFKILLNDPLAQAERISNHYIAHAQMSLQLKRLLEELSHTSAPSKDLYFAIDFCVNEIKRGHLHDFGLELEWKPEQQWLNQALNEGDGTYKP